MCPACGEAGGFGHHGRYEKYLYAQRIEVLRVRCRGCRRTHALMPSFSLPGTSVGTAEAEAYLEGRQRGLSRPVAAAALLEAGAGDRYAKQLERRFTVTISRAKALWPTAANLTLFGLAWVAAACGTDRRPLYALNTYALAHGVNAICFCRSVILLFGRSRAAPHNLGSAAASVAAIGWSSRSSPTRSTR